MSDGGALYDDALSRRQQLMNNGSDIQATWDQFKAAFGLTATGSGTPLSGAAANAENVAQKAIDGHTMATTALNALSANNNASVSAGLDNTTESNMSLFFAGDELQFNLKSTMAFIRCARAGSKGAISFQASRHASAAHFYINVFVFDPVTRDLDYQFSSVDIVASLATSKSWVRWTFPSLIDVTPGDVLVFEFISGDDTGNILWGNDPATPDHPSAALTNVGGWRTIDSSGTQLTPADVDAADYTFVGYAPYVAVEELDVAVPFHPPETTPFTAAGSGSYVIPTWANFVDLIGVGGGNDGNIVSGGESGTWADATLTLPTGTVSAGDTLTVTVGDGGADSTNGGDSTVVKGATTLLTAAGSAFQNSNDFGASPGDHRYNDTNYYGGAPVWIDTPGNAPGGGGGKTAFSIINGAPGGVWIVARQT